MSQKNNTATLDMFEALLQHVGYRGELKRSEFGGYECTPFMHHALDSGLVIVWLKQRRKVMNREPGFYWVKNGGVWIVREWSDSLGGIWTIETEDEVCDCYHDEEWDEIDEHRIVREEPSK